MRPAGEVRQAVLQAVSTLATPERAPTLQEISSVVGQKMPVGRDTVRRYVDHMKRSGALEIVRQRKVDYRNRPVSEYAPAVMDGKRLERGWVQLGSCMQGWGR